jgi:WD40 repeat protein
MVIHRASLALASMVIAIANHTTLAAPPLKPLQQFDPHGESVQALAFSPDGKTIVCGNVDGTVWQWETQTGKEVQHFKASDNWVLSVCFSADGKRLLTGEGDGHVHIWDLKTQKALTTMEATSPFRVVRFYNKDKNIITGDNNYDVRTWDAVSGDALLTMSGHTQMVASLVVSSDGTKAFTGSPDKTVRAWDIVTGAPLFQINFDETVQSIALSPDGSKLYSVISSRVIRVSDAKTGKTLQILKDPAQLGTLAMDISPDGNYLLTSTYDNKARIINASNGAVTAELDGHQDIIWAVAFSHDGHYAITGGGGKSVPPDGAIADVRDDAIRLWDLTTLSTSSATQESP